MKIRQKYSKRPHKSIPFKTIPFDTIYRTTRNLANLDNQINHFKTISQVLCIIVYVHF